jgi:excisionase family DNA binding protein
MSPSRPLALYTDVVGSTSEGERPTHRDREIAEMPRGDGDNLSPPALLDVRAVANLLSCSERHVYRMADAGKMPRPRKLGSLNRWSSHEIQTWIDGGCQPVRHIGARGARA